MSLAKHSKTAVSFIITFIIIWELLSLSLGSGNFPHFWEIIDRFFSSFFQDSKIKMQGGGEKGFSLHLIATTLKFIIGAVLGIGSGILLGLAMFLNKLARVFLEPVIEILRIVPPIIFIPFVYILFDVSNTSQIFIICIYASFSMSIYSFIGFNSIPANFTHLAMVYGFSKYESISKVLIPASLPEIYNGVRVTLPISLGILIVAEYFATPDLGIGKTLQLVEHLGDVHLIFVGSIWVVLISLLIDYLFDRVFQPYLNWKRSSSMQHHKLKDTD